MSSTGLDVFDKTLQTTNIWLDEIMHVLGPERHVAWHVLGAVLRALRDRLPAELSAHLSAQLPLLVRGAYYDRYRPGQGIAPLHSEDAFLHRVAEDLGGIRPVNVRKATQCVFGVLAHHVTAEQVENVKDSLPAPIHALWPPAGTPA